MRTRSQARRRERGFVEVVDVEIDKAVVGLVAAEVLEVQVAARQAGGADLKTPARGRRS